MVSFAAVPHCALSDSTLTPTPLTSRAPTRPPAVLLVAQSLTRTSLSRCSQRSAMADFRACLQAVLDPHYVNAGAIFSIDTLEIVANENLTICSYASVQSSSVLFT